jgi:hypothetical protein
MEQQQRDLSSWIQKFIGQCLPILHGVAGSITDTIVCVVSQEDMGELTRDLAWSDSLSKSMPATASAEKVAGPILLIWRWTSERPNKRPNMRVRVRWFHW